MNLLAQEHCHKHLGIARIPSQTNPEHVENADYACELGPMLFTCHCADASDPDCTAVCEPMKPEELL